MSPHALERNWTTLASLQICTTPHLQVDKETVATPSRPGGVDWYVVRRPQATVVAPRLRDGRFVLIRQERPAVRLITWEFPAGQVDPGGENVQETARRELGEEAGLVCPEALIALGHFYSSVGFTDEVCELFLATNCEFAAHSFEKDHHEAISEVMPVEPAKLSRMIADGEISDANTLSAYARLLAKGLLTP
jgi:ADP-ribose pyrophosphatase